MEDNNWIEWGDVALENGAYYELAFWNRPVTFQDGGKTEGNFYHQGIMKYDNGFIENTYWLRPTPTHIRKIKLTEPIKPFKN